MNKWLLIPVEGKYSNKTSDQLNDILNDRTIEMPHDLFDEVVIDGIEYMYNYVVATMVDNVLYWQYELVKTSDL